MLFDCLRDKQFLVAILIAPIVAWIFTYIFTPNFITQQVVNPIYIIIIYPILEELSFRGAIQGFIARKVNKNFIYQLSYANIITSILFVLTHLFYHQLFWALLVFIPSLIFGYFKDRTTSVMPSIALHMFYNLVYFKIVLQ